MKTINTVSLTPIKPSLLLNQDNQEWRRRRRRLGGGHAAARLARRRLRQLQVGRRARRPLPQAVQAGAQPGAGLRPQQLRAQIRVSE